VLEVHHEAIARFGGSGGVRDFALLESTVAAPQASFAGQSPYKDAYRDGRRLSVEDCPD
jgi:hypothetical protein